MLCVERAQGIFLIKFFIVLTNVLKYNLLMTAVADS